MAKTGKMCIVCGENFQGTAKAEVCGPTCRKRLQRLKEAGKKPEFRLIGGKNSKQKTVIKTEEIEIPNAIVQTDITIKEVPADKVKIIGNKKPSLSDFLKSEKTEEKPKEMNWRLKQKLGIK